MQTHPRTAMHGTSATAYHDIPAVVLDDHTVLRSDEKLRSLIREAADQMCRVVDGNLDFVVRVSEGDEDLDKLLLIVNFVLASARRSFADLSEVHRRMEDDLLAAHRLQEKLLPKQFPNAGNLRLAAKCVPARTVGGDFYDFLRYPGSGLHVGLLADVSGKGAAAAIYAALASGIVRSLTDREMSASAMLSTLNNSLFSRASDGSFVALTYATWDDSNRILEICNSGLPEPLLLRAGAWKRLPLHGLPLGLFRDSQYDAMRIQCQPGDIFVFYTDGIVEQMDREGNEFSANRLTEIISETSHQNPGETVDYIFEQVRRHCSCEMTGDDQTVVIAQVV